MFGELGGVPTRAARVGCLAHRSRVRLLRSLRETSELQTLDHSLSQFSHGYTSKGKVERPSFLLRISGPFYRSVVGEDLRLRMIGLFQRRAQE